MTEFEFFLWIKEYLSEYESKGLTEKQVQYILEVIHDVENPPKKLGGYTWTSSDTFID